MAIDIAIANIPNMAQAGRIIKDGDVGSTGGVMRLARTANGLLVMTCKQIIHNWYHTPITWSAAGTYPHGKANGARWVMPITPPWDEVYFALLAKSTPGINDSTIDVYSRSDNQAVTLAFAAYTWVAAAAVLGVSATGEEEFWLDVTPGAGEMVYLCGVSAWEATRTSF